jgi:hypothetical protein
VPLGDPLLVEDEGEAPIAASHSETGQPGDGHLTIRGF